MTSSLNEIVSNAQKGKGACFECPAHADTRGSLVNPGLLNYNADLMVLTIDPSHYIDWSQYDDWSAYNDDKGEEFKTEMDGGPKLQRLLNGVPGISIDDIWLADAIKCPVNNSRAGDVDSDEAFDHCSEYLEREIAEVDPELILAMGAAPGEQVLEGYFGLCLNWLRTGSRDTALRTGSRDAGRIFDTDPPVVVSPHWSSKGNWLDRNNNRENVQIAIREVLDYRD